MILSALHNDSSNSFRLINWTDTPQILTGKNPDHRTVTTK